MLPDLILETAATCLAFFFMTAPLAQAMDAMVTPAIVQHVNPLNLFCFLLNCTTQLAYGLFMPIAPLILCNAYGVAVGLFSIATCWAVARKAEQHERWNRQACAGTVVALALSTSIAAYAGMGGERAPARVGSLGMLVSIIMYAAPLSVLQEVLRTKSSRPLPALQIILGFLNSLCWFGVGIRHQKIPIWAPNVLGMLLSLVQLVLILMYPASFESEAYGAVETSALLQKELAVQDVESPKPQQQHAAQDLKKESKPPLDPTTVEVDSTPVESPSGIVEPNNDASLEHNPDDNPESKDAAEKGRDEAADPAQ